MLGGGPSKTAVVPKWLTAYVYAQTCRYVFAEELIEICATCKENAAQISDCS